MAFHYDGVKDVLPAVIKMAFINEHLSILFLQMKDILRIHHAINPDHRAHSHVMQLSLDGILESKSSLNSIDTYSVKFSNCRNIYPIRLIRPCEKYKYDEQVELKSVLSDINSNGITIECGVFDAIKRSTVLCIKGHSAKFPCQYCESCAVLYSNSNKTNAAIEKRYNTKNKSLSQELSQLEETLDEPSENEAVMNLRERIENINKDKDTSLQKGRKQLTWPSSTMTGTPRTLDSIREIANAIENDPNIVKTDPNYCKGIKGKSLLLDQPFVHLINDVPCEYMHLMCLGVVKRMLSLTFKVGEHRERKTKRKLSLPKTYNNKIKSIQLPRETSRRCRMLDLGVMKAAEYRNVILFFFPIVIDCIDDTFPKEKQIWLHLAFMIRACVLPNDEFRKVDVFDVNSACANFYKLYEETYGQKNCSYSVHVSSSHILQIRGNAPLTHKSAFKFENFFSELRNLFHPGTISPLKQILKNCFVKRILEHHECDKTTFFAVPKKPKPGKKFNPTKENNHLIYTVNEENQIDIYDIYEIIDHETFLCKMQGKFQLKHPLTPEYNWSDVGVYRTGPLSEEDHVIPRNDIRGKVIKVNGYLITCPNNVLHEQ